MPITLLHTADVHVATFDTRLHGLEDVTHIVRADWLKRARSEGITAQLKTEIAAVIDSARGVVMCTCTTLGPVAENLGALRVDHPMMDAAARSDGPIAMAYCLESTRAPSFTLLRAATAHTGQRLDLIDCSAAWAYFETGDIQTFAQTIAESVNVHLAQHQDTQTIVLAQVSMASAARLIDGASVLTSIDTAIEALIAATH